jgi:chromate transporter
MAVVSVKLGASSLTNITTVLIFVGSMIGIMRFKLNTVWLIAAGGLITFVASLV